MISVVAGALGLLCAVWAAVSYGREPRRLRNGVLLMVAVLCALVALTNLSWPAADAIVAAITVPLAALAALAYLSLALFLLVNGLIVVLREGRSLALLLPLLTGIALLAVPAFILWELIAQPRITGLILPTVTLSVVGAASYMGFVLLCFVSYSILYRLRSQSDEGGAILMLGSRVIEGRVPPLLAARLDRAIAVFRARESRGDTTPMMICCGGQGPDESCSEASAMAAYLREKGIPEESIFREDQSTTTQENLMFGTRIAEREDAAAPLLISTNDYHVFRTALLSRKLGLQAEVLSARTARYYVPAAFLREFIAIVRDYLWIHLGMLCLFAAFVGFLVWESLQQH